MCQQALQGSRLAHVDDDDQIAVEKAMSRAELVEKLGLVVGASSLALRCTCCGVVRLLQFCGVHFYCFFSALCPLRYSLSYMQLVVPAA